MFAARYKKKNSFRALFFFRLYIEVNHISPFRNFFKLRTKTVTLRLPHFGDMTLKFHLDDHFQMAICEEFVKYNVYDLSALTFVPDSIIDCGAYKGYFTFRAAAMFPYCKKVCIEPHSQNMIELTSVVYREGLGNVQLINKAISDAGETIMLEKSGSNMMANLDLRADIILQEVDSISLYSLLDDLAPSAKLLLKMDIEGSELDFFPGCIKDLPSCCAVFLETHDGWHSLTHIKEAFINHGFSFSLIRERGAFIDSFAIRNP